MFHMNQNLKVVLAVEPADLRKSFNGLYTIARNERGEIPEDGAMFIFSNRAAECLDSMLTGYSGLLQTDGYICYTSWLNDEKHSAEKEKIIHASCWAHARRKFVEAGDSISRKIVKLIAKLYRPKTELRKKNPNLIE
ncbi:MAG: transposase [Pontiella sp.]